MTDPDLRPSPVAGGFPLIFCILTGVIIGLLRGQPSIGFLAGLAVGVAIAVLLWLRDRRHD